MRDGPYGFTAGPLRVLGVDENGYGPRLGPLVVTGVVLRYEGEDPEEELHLRQGWPLGIRDSKQVFRRSVASYARGEALVLGLLDPPPPTLEALMQRLYGDAQVDVWRASPYHADLSLPYWASGIRNLRSALDRRGLAVERVWGRVLWPEGLRRSGNKLQANLHTFLALVEESQPDWALLGRIGGMKHYAPHLPEGWQTLEEGPDSTYRAPDGKRLGFYLHADDRFLPVALASLVGKYVRELLMLAVNRNLGLEGPIPLASGYHHDPRTALLQEAARRRGWDLERP